jgi:putative copper resistance protein D
LFLQKNNGVKKEQLMVELLGIFGFLVVLLRAAILSLQTVAIGGVFFLMVAASGAELRGEALLRSSWKLIRWTALGLAISQLLFVITNSLVLTYSADISLREVLGANFVIAGWLAMAGGLAIFLWPAKLRESVNPIVLVPAGLILAASVMTSHSASRMDERGILVTLTALHYLGTASWIGGIPYLLLTMKQISDADTRGRISQRFSRLAQISVVVLFAAGLGMSYVYVGSWAAVYGTAYGVMVSMKVALFFCLLLLGAANYYIVKEIPADAGGQTKSLIRFGEAEIGIGLTVILTAASLTSQPPGVDMTQERVTYQEIATRFAPRMPRLSSPDLKDLSEPTKQAYRRAMDAGESMPASFVPGQMASHPNKPADIAWSEYNHNWAGLIVCLMGILALLSRSRYFSWAKIWPLAFLLLAVFLFLRADPENWPLGPNGFWASFSDAEVLQHRAIVLLIIAFAAFQWMVETKRVKSPGAALVFPGVCALGGAVLLTHSHALGNIKEELLAEFSHAQLAFFGIMAGWSRWLELRLPQENKTRQYLSWVWPVCFILVGLILMDYHES